MKTTPIFRFATKQGYRWSGTPFILAALACGGCSGAGNGEIVKHKKNTDVASRHVAELLSGNAGSLFEDLFPSEIAGLELTQEKVRALYADLIAPVLKQARADGPMVVQVDPKTLSGVAMQKLRSNKDVPGSFGLGAELTPEGPKVSLMSVLAQVWVLEAGFRKGRQLNGIEKRKAVLQGFQRDRSVLVRDGISRLMHEPTGKSLPLDQWENDIEAKIKEQMKFQQTAQNG